MNQSNDLDKLLTSLFTGCMEATCAECGLIATGTNQYHVMVARYALKHQETSGHHVDICDWSEPPYESLGERS